MIIKLQDLLYKWTRTNRTRYVIQHIITYIHFFSSENIATTEDNVGSTTVSATSKVYLTNKPLAIASNGTDGKFNCN